jgi:ATP-dependent helicase/nuclease subunit B
LACPLAEFALRLVEYKPNDAQGKIVETYSDIDPAAALALGLSPYPRVFASLTVKTMALQAINPLSPHVWEDIANSIRGWCNTQKIPLRDVCIVVPLTAHLPLAKAAMARALAANDWMPRIDTAATLAAALAPQPVAQPGQISFDVASDRLLAQELLTPHLSRTAWASRDAPGHALMVAEVTDLAQQLARAAQVLPPGRREAYWLNARSRLSQGSAAGGAGHSERLLAQMALAWAALAAAPATEVLFWHRPDAWVMVQAGGPDALLNAVASEAMEHGIPVLQLQADDFFSDGSAWSTTWIDSGRTIFEAACLDFEDEAQRAAARVLAHVQAGEVPVALVALDRLLVRRVRALLARQRLAVLDETGWTLSTTRAAALVASALRLADPMVSADDVLDALKSIAAPLGQVASLSPQAVCELEFTWRKRAWRQPQAVQAEYLSKPAALLWQELQSAVQPLQASRTRTLGEWLDVLQALLNRFGLLSALQNDDAGSQVLQRLSASRSWANTLSSQLGYTAFCQWLDDVFEHANFVPFKPTDPVVVITPLSRTALREFAAVVFPGTDERQLGAWPSSPALLSRSMADAIGLPTAEQQRQAQRLAFCQLLRAPRITLLRRMTDQDELLSASPFVLALGATLTIEPANDSRIPVPVARTLATHPPQPTAPGHLPKQLSASSLEMLRQCPYRFFALHMLKLRASDELDEALAKRDYGTWLHHVLLRFHQQRAETGPADLAQETSTLHTLATEALRGQGFDEAEFLPYAATFRRLIPRYLSWLHQRDADGALWLDGERALRAEPAAWEGVAMVGEIDRVDSVMDEHAGPVIQLIDYKTGSVAELRKKIKQPLEDTQLAFYAALMAEQSNAIGSLAAAYMALDDSETIHVLAHPDVEHSAEQLLSGVARDLQRIRAGTPLPALGEGAVCETCEARGLCRRDQWEGRA